LYVGIVVIIIILGLKYSSATPTTLTQLLLRTSIIFIYLSICINMAALLFGLSYLSTHELGLFSNSYTFSLFSQLAKLLALIFIGGFYAFFPSVYLTRMRVLELPLLIQIAAALCSTIISSTNFATLLLALEGFSLILYIMTTLGRSYGGVTAAVKYFAFGTLGSIFLFWGVIHIYTLVPSLNFAVSNTLLQQSFFESANLSNALEFATTSIAFGFMLKLGAAPMHQWVADVYAGSHIFITSFFAIFVKFILFVAFLHIAVYFNCDALMKLCIMLSLVVGCVLSVRQTEIKRLIAYSSIVHVAFLLMGDASSSLIYILTYTISSFLLFSVLLNLQIAGKELIYLNDLRFIRSTSHMQTLYLVVALASSAGLPPFAGFYGKFLVWSSLIEDIYLSNNATTYVILFLSIAVSLISIFYYMRVIAYLFIGNDSNVQSAHVGSHSNTFLNSTTILVQTLLSILIIFWTFVQLWLLGVVGCVVL